MGNTENKYPARCACYYNSTGVCPLDYVSEDDLIDRRLSTDSSGHYGPGVPRDDYNYCLDLASYIIAHDVPVDRYGHQYGMHRKCVVQFLRDLGVYPA